jgi:N-acetylneuraminic acid mutarotase
MAIGWICIEAGNPGVWAEFGGMFDEPIELDPGSVGMDELNSEVKSKLLLGDSIVINVQALQSAVANCATKDDLKNIDLSLYATKEDLSEKVDIVNNEYIDDANDVFNIQGVRFTNDSTLNLPIDLLDDDSKWGVIKTTIDHEGDGIQEFIPDYGDWRAVHFKRYVYANSSIYGNWYYDLDSSNWDVELQTDSSEILGAINEVNEKVNYAISALGNGNELLTNNKTNVVAAINEVFQSGVNVKQNLVDALIAKNIDCSTSNTFEELISKVNELSLNPFSEWAKANCWLAAGSCTALPATTYAATAQAYKGKIYVIGGYGTTTAVRVYDPKYNTWATTGFAAMPTGRYGLDSTIIDDKIYCIGGYNNLTTNQVYDITNNKWTTLAAMTTGREYLTVDAVGTNIYAIGGSGSSTYLNTNQCYDTLTNTWTTKTTMTAAKYDHASGVIGTDIYCIAGYTGSAVTTNYKYSTTTNTWTTMKAATARRAACCNNIEDKLYYNHGSNASTTYYANNYMYDPVANTWTTMTTGITASKAKYRTSAVVNNMMFVFGGYNGSALNLVDCYIV